MGTPITLPSDDQIQQRINLCRAELAEWKRVLRAVRAAKKAEEARQARQGSMSGEGAKHGQ
jgi:hypothetical protein